MLGNDRPTGLGWVAYIYDPKSTATVGHVQNPGLLPDLALVGKANVVIGRGAAQEGFRGPQ